MKKLFTKDVKKIMKNKINEMKKYQIIVDKMYEIYEKFNKQALDNHLTKKIKKEFGDDWTFKITKEYGSYKCLLMHKNDYANGLIMYCGGLLDNEPNWKNLKEQLIISDCTDYIQKLENEIKIVYKIVNKWNKINSLISEIKDLNCECIVENTVLNRVNYNLSSTLRNILKEHRNEI